MAIETGTTSNDAEEDLEVSSEIDLATWRTRPAYMRIGEYATELIRQSL